MNKNFRLIRGMAQIPLLIVLLLMAVAVPVATTLVQNNQENRSQAVAGRGNTANKGYAGVPANTATTTNTKAVNAPNTGGSSVLDNYKYNVTQTASGYIAPNVKTYNDEHNISDEQAIAAAQAQVATQNAADAAGGGDKPLYTVAKPTEVPSLKIDVTIPIRDIKNFGSGFLSTLGNSLVPTQLVILKNAIQSTAQSGLSPTQIAAGFANGVVSVLTPSSLSTIKQIVDGYNSSNIKTIVSQTGTDTLRSGQRGISDTVTKNINTSVTQTQKAVQIGAGGGVLENYLHLTGRTGGNQIDYTDTLKVINDYKAARDEGAAIIAARTASPGDTAAITKAIEDARNGVYVPPAGAAATAYENSINTSNTTVVLDTYESVKSSPVCSGLTVDQASCDAAVQAAVAAAVLAAAGGPTATINTAGLGPDDTCKAAHGNDQSCYGSGTVGDCICGQLGSPKCYNSTGASIDCSAVHVGGGGVAINAIYGPNGVVLKYLDEASAKSQCGNGYHGSGSAWFCGAGNTGDGSGSSDGTGTSTSGGTTTTGTNTGAGVGTPSILNYKVAYGGVNPNSAQCLVDWPLQIIVLGNGQSVAYTGVIPTSKTTVGNKLVFSGSLTLNGFGQTNNVAVFIKGPKHLQVKYGKNNQTEPYNLAGGVLTLTSNVSTSPVYDFSGFPLLPGDVVGVSSDVQDGWVNGVDFSLVKSKSLVHETVQTGGYLTGDLDGNCQVNSNDVNLLKISLQDKQGQLY